MASAVVLRGRNLGEADRIFTLFTREHGKVDAVAKGVRRTKSHFAGRLQFMSEATLTLHRGRNLDVITSAQTLRSRWTSIVEPSAFATAHLLAEMVDAFCELDLALPEIYDLLTGAIGALGQGPAPAELVPRFSLRLLHALGLAPPDADCVRCGAVLEDGACVDTDAGGLVCGACRGHRETIELDAEDLANFRALGAPRGGAVRPTAFATERAARAVDALVTHHLGKRPRSRALVDAFEAPR
jgi:DNA repair protein RecO (recombination protein O)